MSRVTNTYNRLNKTVKKAPGIHYPLSPRLLPLKEAAAYIGLIVWGMRERNGIFKSKARKTLMKAYEG